jgi:hypothetical protein
MIILSNNNQIEFTIKTIYSCHCLDYRDTILALKASGVSNSTMSGASRFQFTSKANKTLGFLRRNLKIPSIRIKEQAYFTLARPLVEYASTVWVYTVVTVWTIGTRSLP